MKTPKILLSASLLLSICFQSNAADDRFANVEIKAQKLTETTYMFAGAGGNIGVSAGEDGILIIDDQFAPLANKIEAALADIQPGMPKFIINTHYHGDHTGSNAHFGKHGTIMAHHNVLKRLSNNEKSTASALPVITYEQGISVHFNQDTLQIIHMGPGHTDGDSIVLWKQTPLVHMGDLFFKDRFPYIDLKGGGSVTGYRDNVAKALAMMSAQTQIIPGHGSLANKQDLQRFKAMLDESIEWMQSIQKQGISLEQAKQQGVPTKWKDWSWRFISEDRWIETLYQGLQK
ncbi:MBL fold metallo-hydrolase [Shewanella gelidii]|uniref:Cyclase n=1 Tax=Shewanella gelidii TaxID=1642821 RepID=A0A917N801_9GAMM|nr:MBL fold metallo-hydrolase [Shewanella gelidii]MCL1099191.1 MBL fold metallo-hydrolase [Shewanella gelidii]GGI76314.1 cyclase [Shewanella gelidii]